MVDMWVRMRVTCAQAAQSVNVFPDRETWLVRYASHVTSHTPHVTRHMSHVTRHTSHVTRHTSHVTRHSPASVIALMLRLLGQVSLCHHR